MLRLTHARFTVIAATFIVALTTACSGDDDEGPVTTATNGDPGATEGTYHSEVRVGERSYDLYVPASHDPAALTPAVIAFHGRPGSPTDIQRASGLDVLADQEGFLAVFPRGEDRQWEPEAGGADMAYVEELIGDLVDSWGADPERIYVTGFSNGADMAIVSALSLPDQVAAAAPVTPSGTGSVTEVIDELAAPVPVAAFIGETDERAELGLDMLSAWRDGAGCEEADPTGTEGDITTSSWTCDGAPFRVHVVAGQGHVWFGGPADREPLWASETMWEFFSALP